MRSLAKSATATAVRTMGKVAVSSHAADSGVGTKNSSREGSRGRRLALSLSKILARIRSLGASPDTTGRIARPCLTRDRSISDQILYGHWYYATLPSSHKKIGNFGLSRPRINIGPVKKEERDALASSGEIRFGNI